MKLAGKILVASAAALGMIGSGFAAWNYVSNGAATVTKEVTPSTSGTVELQAELLDVTSSNKQLVLVPGSEELDLSYNVKYKGSEFKGNEQLTVKVKANKEGLSNYLSLPAEIEVAPAIWHSEENAANGYDVELEFAWVVGETEVTDLLAYAKEHYPTTAAQQAFLAPYETAIDGVKFTITFDIEYGEVAPAASSIEAILDHGSIEVNGTSALMVADDLDVYYEPSEYNIVEKSEGFDGVVSYENGVFTGLAAGTASFKVQVGELKSEELTLTVTAKQSEEPTQEPTLSKIAEYSYAHPTSAISGNSMYNGAISGDVLSKVKEGGNSEAIKAAVASGKVFSDNGAYTGFKFNSSNDNNGKLSLTLDETLAIRKVEVDAIAWSSSDTAAFKFDEDTAISFANKDGTTVETFAKESDDAIESITFSGTKRFVITAIRLYAFN